MHGSTLELTMELLQLLVELCQPCYCGDGSLSAATLLLSACILCFLDAETNHSLGPQCCLTMSSW